MAYKFHIDETMQTGVRRCANEQLQAAIDRLAPDSATDPVETVHDARKSIKKARSLLRLAGPAMDSDQRRQENAALRSIAHGLAGARESDALLATLDELADRYAGQVPAATVDAPRDRLRVGRDDARATLRRDNVPERATDELRAVLERTSELTLEQDGWPAVAAGLERSYRRGRRAMRKARKSSSPERMHDWRRRSKDLWYQLRLLEPISPGAMGGAAKDAHRLADLLGDGHDLAQLDQALHTFSPEVAADLGPLHGLIAHRAAQLRGEAFTVGERVYAESPKAFAKRMGRYWEASRAVAGRDERPEMLAEATRQPSVA